MVGALDWGRMNRFKSSFNERKAAQATARLLRAAGGSFDYLMLVKLLYLIERTSLLERFRPILDDEYYSLPFGPVVSRVMDLTTNKAWGSTGFWAQHIAKDSYHLVTLISDPGNDELSESEELVIDRIWNDFGKLSKSELLDYAHALPEWQDPGSSSIPITVETILKKGDKSELAAAVARELEIVRADRDFFESF